MIEFRNVSFSYGKTPVLSGLDLACHDGAITALLGINGSGKTTAARCAMGLISHSGEVLIDGERRTKGREKLISYLPQALPAPKITVRELVLMGRTPHMGLYGKESALDTEAVEQAIERLGLGELVRRRVDTLSGGQRQSAFLAMVIAAGTNNIILDEPSSFMDAANERGFYSLLHALRGEGKSILLISHSIPAALNNADRIAVLHGGSTAFCGTPDECAAEGVLTDIFGVHLHRFTADGAERYFCS